MYYLFNFFIFTYYNKIFSQVPPTSLHTSGGNVLHHTRIHPNQNAKLSDPTSAQNVNVNLESVPSASNVS
jgi:hypothetical protein